jgi:hypothetical protein
LEAGELPGIPPGLPLAGEGEPLLVSTLAEPAGVGPCDGVFSPAPVLVPVAAAEAPGWEPVVPGLVCDSVLLLPVPRFEPWEALSGVSFLPQAAKERLPASRMESRVALVMVQFPSLV